MPLFEKDRKEVLSRLGELVIKDVAEAGGYGVVFGSSLDKMQREELADRIKLILVDLLPKRLFIFGILMLSMKKQEKFLLENAITRFVLTGRTPMYGIRV